MTGTDKRAAWSMTEDQERTVMVLLAALGLASEIYARRQMIAKLTAGGSSNRAAQYHGAMTMYRKCAEWFGRQALRAETSYWEEVQGNEHSHGGAGVPECSCGRSGCGEGGGGAGGGAAAQRRGARGDQGGAGGAAQGEGGVGG